MREVQEPIVDDRGCEHHPAFVRIEANRVSAIPSAVLFDSDLTHQHYISLRIHTATRKRDLNHDYIHAGKQLIEVNLTEAQWGQLISAMNAGGTPATLSWTAQDGPIPGLSYAPRMAQNLEEIRQAADQQMEKARAALEAYKAHKTVGNLRTLEFALANSASNTEFVAKSLSAHVEKTITRAKADIEAMVVSAAQHGVAVDAAGFIPELTSGVEGDDVPAS